MCTTAAAWRRVGSRCEPEHVWCTNESPLLSDHTHTHKHTLPKEPSDLQQCAQRAARAFLSCTFFAHTHALNVKTLRRGSDGGARERQSGN